MTATINANASGVWAAREGETVEIVGRKHCGLATAIRLRGEKRTVFVPTRWLTRNGDCDAR